MSNGTDSLTERDARTFKATRTWVVKRADGAVDQLNELDFDGTNLWANRWRTNEIVRIDPVCQQVTAVVDASSLTHAAEQAATGSIDVLNGIASIPGTDHFLVTGKYWPVMFEVTFVPA